MSPKSPLEDKIILVVDDEPDVLETVGEILDMCLLYKAKSYEEGIEYLRGYVDKGIPTVMLTAHALTPEALKKSMKLGALTFLPKEKLSDLQEFLEDVVLGGGKAIWIKFFDRLGAYFDKRFGPDWKEKDEFFRDFEEAVRSEVGSEK
jgi:hypothetical protein